MNKAQFKAFEADILPLTEQQALRGGDDGYETCNYSRTAGLSVTVNLPILSDIFGGVTVYDDSDVEESPDWVSTC